MTPSSPGESSQLAEPAPEAQADPATGGRAAAAAAAIEFGFER